MTALGRIEALLLVVALLAVVGAPVASAQNAVVYATYGVDDDRGPGGPIGILPGVTMTAHLWVSGGELPSSGPPCNPGMMGNEICGVRFSLRASAVGKFQIENFTPDTTFDSSESGLPFVVWYLSPVPSNRLSANGIDLGTPTVDPMSRNASSRHLGTVELSLGEFKTQDYINFEDFKITVEGGVVGANLEMRSLTPGDVFVVPTPDIIIPEPRFAAGLMLGWATMLSCSRLREKMRNP